MPFRKPIFFLVLTILCTLLGCKSKPQEVVFESPYEIIPELEEVKNLNSKADPEINKQQTASSGASVLAASSAALDPDFKPSVKDIQLALKNSGFYQGNIDGKFGPRTKVAVKDFQRENALKVDGVVGKMTWEKLKNYYGTSSKTPQKQN